MSPTEPEVVLVRLDLPSAVTEVGVLAAGIVPMVASPCSATGETAPAGSFFREGPDRGWKPEPSGAKAGWLGVPPSIS